MRERRAYKLCRHYSGTLRLEVYGLLYKRSSLEMRQDNRKEPRSQSLHAETQCVQFTKRNCSEVEGCCGFDNIPDASESCQGT